MAEQVKKALGTRYEYALQEPQAGTAHAVKAAKDKIKAENVLVLYADMPFIIEESLRKLMRLHHDQKANISLFTTTVPDFKVEFSGFLHFGRIIRNFKHEIIKIIEYRDASEKDRQIKEINPGIYMFNTQWLWENIKKIKNKNVQKEYYLGDIVELAIAQKQHIHSLPISPKEVIGINTQEDLDKAEKIL
ncbi:MAG: NTP transferase domain-containing protein [Candidatus Doudnabacteria bacterium]|nr:NTP transferase domain-containing protein [Candidatus Doudnabacteria bacterium]